MVDHDRLKFGCKKRVELGDCFASFDRLFEYGDDNISGCGLNSGRVVLYDLRDALGNE